MLMPCLFLKSMKCATKCVCLTVALLLAGCNPPAPSVDPVVPTAPEETEAPEADSATETPEATSEMTPAAPAPETAAPEKVTETPASSEPGEKKTAGQWEQKGITLKQANWDEVQKIIADQKGKVVVVDLWSTWCVPCVRELPHLVELQKKYPDQVVCISLNVNYDGSESTPPKSNAEEVLEVLVKNEAKLINLLSSTADEELYGTLDLASIPVAYVYQTDGTLSKRFDNETSAYGEEGFTYQDHITPHVAELLTK